MSQDRAGNEIQCPNCFICPSIRWDGIPAGEKVYCSTCGQAVAKLDHNGRPVQLGLGGNCISNPYMSSREK